MIVNLSKYTQAGFDTLMQFGGGSIPTQWCAGFFCQGPESYLNDGLICFAPMQGEDEETRQQHLSPVCKSPQKAINQAYGLWQEWREQETQLDICGENGIIEVPVSAS